MLCTVADGGEGTLDAALAAGFHRRVATVSGPTREPVEAAIAVRESTAAIGMALASGLAVLPGGVLRARDASSRGTGELIRFALDRGCASIVLGIGGSANTDGGAGMLEGLGAVLLDDAGTPLPSGNAALADVASSYSWPDPLMTSPSMPVGGIASITGLSLHSANPQCEKVTLVTHIELVRRDRHRALDDCLHL